MQLPTQAQFVEDCYRKYDYEDIPANQKWEDAHFPLPNCLGGEATVPLWSADHTVQGLLQSVELDHKCFHHNANKTDTFHLMAYNPEYLELFALLKSKFNLRHAKKGGEKSAELKLGIHGRSAEQMKADGKKSGKISGKKAAELKVGIHAPGVQSAAGKIGGKKGGPIGGQITGAQKWQCLVTGHICNAGPLSRYQKARSIDTSLRVRRFDLEG